MWVGVESARHRSLSTSSQPNSAPATLRTGNHGGCSNIDRRARKHYKQIRYEQGTTADLKLLRHPVREKKVVCQGTWKLGGALKPTARGTPKRSARFFLRSSSSGSRGSCGAPRFLAGCFLFSAGASVPKRSALAFSFPSSYSIA